MQCDEVLNELSAMGTAQNRKVYARHGVREPLFGVSYKNLGALKKKLKTNHALARQLWSTQNHDARVLATMIADPARLTSAEVNRWAKQLDNYVLTDALSTLVASAPLAQQTAIQWRHSRSEWIAACGWSVLSRLALDDEAFSDELGMQLLREIEANLHASPNRVRHAMNQTLISLGVRNAKLRRAVLAAAKRIGKVEVDHGQTGCKTPDAAAYIAKTLARRAR